jgi:hypothetical protein
VFAKESFLGVSTMMQIANPIRGTSGVRTGATQALEAVGDLRREVSGLDVPDDVRSRAGWALDDMVDELCRPDPDRDVMASRLWRLTEFLQGSGVDAGPGTPPFGPIAVIAAWVGPLGEALLKRLG